MLPVNSGQPQFFNEHCKDTQFACQSLLHGNMAGYRTLICYDSYEFFYDFMG
jgi:hypothetical protein